MERVTARKLIRVTLLALLAALTAYGMFSLPWLMPVHVRVIDSVSQQVGFSNRTAVLAAILGALAIALVSRATRSDPSIPFVSVEPPDHSERLGWPVIALVAAAAGAVVIAAGIHLAARPVLDSGYFVDRMLLAVNGSVPYSQFEFSYGPLMLYPQAWLFLALHRWGVSSDWTYYGWLATVQVIGVLLAGYIVERLTIPSKWTKLWLLLAIVVVDAPLLSLNMSLVRFMVPYALLLAVLGVAGRRGFGPLAALLAILSVALSALISPEQGIALLAGFLVAFAVVAWRGSPRSRVALGLLVVAGATLGLAASRLPMLRWASSGVYNIPVFLGTPQVAMFVALIVVAVGVGSEFRLAALDNAPLLAGWFVVGLALVSAAFGRADGMHVFLNTAGLLLGAAALASHHRVSTFWVITAGALAFGLVTYAGSLSAIGGLPPVTAENGPEIATLASIPRIAVVGVLGDRLGESLVLRKAVVPTYGWHMYDALEVQRTVAQASAAQYLLVPTSKYLAFAKVKPPPDGYFMRLSPTTSPQWATNLYGVPLTATPRYQALDGQRSLYPALLARFKYVRQIDAWTLLERL